MTANVGNADRYFRIALGFVLIAAPLLNIPAIWSGSALFYVSIAVGMIVIATALFRFCPLYRVIGLSTCKLH